MTTQPVTEIIDSDLTSANSMTATIQLADGAIKGDLKPEQVLSTIHQQVQKATKLVELLKKTKAELDKIKPGWFDWIKEWWNPSSLQLAEETAALADKAKDSSLDDLQKFTAEKLQPLQNPDVNNTLGAAVSPVNDSIDMLANALDKETNLLVQKQQELEKSLTIFQSVVNAMNKACTPPPA